MASQLTKKEISQIKALQKKGQAILDRIAKERDALRDLVDEYASLACEFDIILDDLENGIDQLSQYI